MQGPSTHGIGKASFYKNRLRYSEDIPVHPFCTLAQRPLLQAGLEADSFFYWYTYLR